MDRYQVAVHRIAVVKDYRYVGFVGNFTLYVGNAQHRGKAGGVTLDVLEILDGVTLGKTDWASVELVGGSLVVGINVVQPEIGTPLGDPVQGGAPLTVIGRFLLVQLWRRGDGNVTNGDQEILCARSRGNPCR